MVQSRFMGRLRALYRAIDKFFMGATGTEAEVAAYWAAAFTAFQAENAAAAYYARHDEAIDASKTGNDWFRP